MLFYFSFYFCAVVSVIKRRGNVFGIRNEGGSYWITDNWPYHTQVNCRLLLHSFLHAIIGSLHTRFDYTHTTNSLKLCVERKIKLRMEREKKTNFLLYYLKWKIYLCQSYFHYLLGMFKALRKKNTYRRAEWMKVS